MNSSLHSSFKGPRIPELQTVSSTPINLDGSIEITHVDASARNITINLPAISTVPGFPLTIKKVDNSSFTVTVVAAGSDTIEGAGSVVLANPSDVLAIYNDGIKWFKSANWVGALSGSGVTGQIPYWGSSSSLSSANNLTWDAGNSRLGIGTASPTATLTVAGPADLQTAPGATVGSSTTVRLRSNAGIAETSEKGASFDIVGKSAQQQYTASSGALTISMSKSTAVHIAMDADLTVNNPSLASNLFSGSVVIPQGLGTTLTMVFVQNSTGYHKITLGANFNDSAKYQIRQGPNQRSQITWVLGADNTWTVKEVNAIDLTKPLDPHDFGAKGDNATDDWLAIQTMLNTTAVHSGFNPDFGTVAFNFRVGSYLVSKPLTLSPNGNVAQSIIGQGIEATAFRQYGALYGPLLWAGPSYSAQSIMVSGAPAVGSGVAWRLSYNAQFVNLSQTPVCEVNGLSQLTKRFWINPDSVSQFSVDHVSSPFGSPVHGQVQSGMTVEITGLGATVGNYCVVASIFTTSGSFTISSANTGHTYPVGSWQYVSVEYDGSDFALYVGPRGGTVTRVDHTAVTGTIVRPHYHEECIGFASPKFPQSNGSHNTLTGYLDSFEMLSTRVHSSGTTSFSAPTIKHVASSNTMILINFDSFDRNFIVATTGTNGVVYLPLFITTLGVGQRNGIHLRNLMIQNVYGGAFMFNALLDSTFEDLKLNSYLPWFGWDNSYNLGARNLVIDCASAGGGAVSPYGMGFAQTCGGLSVYQHIWITGGKTAIAHGGGFGGVWNQCYIQPSSDLIIGCFFTGEPNSTAVFNAFGVDGEGGWLDFELGMYVTSGSTLTFKDSYFEWSGFHTIDSPAFKIDGGVSSLVLEDCMITHSEGVDTKVFEFTGPPGGFSVPPETIILRNTKQVNGTKIPWTDVSNTYRLRMEEMTLNIDKSQFNAASTTQTITVGTLGPGTRVKSIYLYQTDGFAGPSITALQARVGQTSGGNEYLLDYNAATSTTAYGLVPGDLGINMTTNYVQNGYMPSYSSTSTIYLTLTATGANLGNGTVTNLTSGALSLILTLDTIQAN